MSRPIKFRVWMKFPEGGGRMVDFWEALILHNISINSLKEMINSEVFIIQQFTNLKDKNGKEIFEGDILGIFDYQDHLEEILIIEWKKAFSGELFCASKLNGELWDFYGGIPNSEWNDIKIIGNIFENLELLKNNEVNKT